jgi:D-alanine-D-alanine ligase
VRVAVLSGGRSSEHDVSLASGEAIRVGLAEAGHEVLDVRIERDGTWRRDGEGLLEILDVAYVGAGVLASALCMDKVLFKELMGRRGVPQVAYVGVEDARWRGDREGVLREIALLGIPVFVKPARLGSSVGIAKATAESEIATGLDAAFAHDPLAIVEAMSTGIEVECSVMGTTEPVASQPGEIVLAGGADWYDYEAKYEPGGMELVIPARISEAARGRVRALAVEVFVASGCSGFARADFFVEGEDVIVNELNTIPGFTPTSGFPKLFEASGVPFPELVDRLCGYAVERHERERAYRY